MKNMINYGQVSSNNEDLPFSDSRAVKTYILNRALVDPMFFYREPLGENEITKGIPCFDEDKLLTYIDLDRLINQCNLNSYQKNLIQLFQEGKTAKMVADELGKNQWTVKRELKKICKWIAELEEYNRQEVMEINGIIKIPDDVKYRQCEICEDFRREKYFKKRGKMKNICKFCARSLK